MSVLLDRMEVVTWDYAFNIFINNRMYMSGSVSDRSDQKIGNVGT